MSHDTHYETAAEDRIPFLLKIVYGFGAFVNNILAAAIGGMVIVLNLVSDIAYCYLDPRISVGGGKHQCSCEPA